MQKIFEGQQCLSIAIALVTLHLFECNDNNLMDFIISLQYFQLFVLQKSNIKYLSKTKQNQIPDSANCNPPALFQKSGIMFKLLVLQKIENTIQNGQYQQNRVYLICKRELTILIKIPIQQKMQEQKQKQKINESERVVRKMSSLLNCEQIPVDTVVRIDDKYCSKSGYFEMHDLNFQIEEVAYGNQEMRRNYNITKQLKRYFAKRYFYFSLFDEGIQLDNQSWYSVIAQPISLYLCERLKYYGVKKLFQPFCGVGGIAVHAAGNFEQLVINDIDQSKIKMLKNNLNIYGKGLNLLTIHNKDYIKIKPFPVDAVVICPPWGGIDIYEYSYRDLDQIMQPKLSDILNHCKKFSPNMILQMPKNTNLQNLLKIINLCFICPIVKVEKIVVDGKVSQLFVYVGDVKFTAVNPTVFNQIIKDLEVQPKSIKEFKKDIKQKLKQENFQLFTEIFNRKIIKPNKHIFFNDN